MYSFPPIAFLVGIASSIVTFLTDLGLAPAVAVVALTVLVRAALLPVGWSQVKAEAARRRIAPMLAEVQRRFKNDPQKLQQATLRLYQRQGTSPLAGCLPALLQAPVFLAVYGLFLSSEVHGEPNHLLEATLWDVALGDRLPQVVGEPTAVALFAGLAVVLAVVGWLHLRITPPPPVPPETPTAQSMQRVFRLAPFFVLVAVPVVPLAAVLYLATTTAWTVAERTVLRRILAHRSRPRQQPASNRRSDPSR